MANSKKTKLKAKMKKPVKKKKTISLLVKVVKTKKSSTKPAGSKKKVIKHTRKTTAEVLSKKELTKKLLKDKANLLSDVTEKIKNASNALKEIGDIYDDASNERERELTLMIGDMEREKLFAIEEALERIKSGSHGICDNCGEQIGKARLMALPFTKVCIECKSKEERVKGARKHYEEEGGLAILEKTEADEEEF